MPAGEGKFQVSTQNLNPLTEHSSTQQHSHSTATSNSTFEGQPFSHVDSILLIRQQQERLEA